METLPAPSNHQEPAYVQSPQDFQDENRGGLIEYWQILRRRKGTVLLVAFLGILAGVLVTLPQTPVYQARTSLEIQDLNQDFLNMRQVNPVTEGGSSYTALTDIQTQIKIIQSETLAERTTAKLNLTTPRDLKLQTTRIAAWRQALNLPDPKPVDAREAILKAMAKNMKVRAAGQTRIIEVLIDSTDPTLAANFANTLANEFIDQNMQARWQMTQRTGDWLSRQLDDMRIKLERSEDGLQAYARQSGLMFTSEKQNVSEEKLRQLQLSL
ncbi:MAG: Wzz/FepE/Etk N-terminal domain-containing protein, partial [Acidobacteria bacterium]|nr:Wzz/FepE/Etk N-terminal domain-containing protein [Acidobacteriota bacterium]